MKAVLFLPIFFNIAISFNTIIKQPASVIANLATPADTIPPRDLPGQTIEPELKKYYDEYNVDGMFAFYDPQKNNYIYYNKQKIGQKITPASTFNIVLALIGLEEKILKDKSSLLKFEDSLRLGNPNSDKDQTLEDAFKNNRDWFFKVLSRKIGQQKIKKWLQKIHYGNESTEGQPNFFWVNGNLLITPEQQLGFIQKFYREALPFKKENIAIVKELLHEDAITDMNIFGKRGSNKIPSQKKYTGWYVGYLKTAKGIYFLTSYLESPDLEHPKLVDAQKQIPFKILRQLQLN